MQRVQAALKAQLSKQNEKLEIELREKVSTEIEFEASITTIFSLGQDFEEFTTRP